jgi:hypothetical protein
MRLRFGSVVGVALLVGVAWHSLLWTLLSLDLLAFAFTWLDLVSFHYGPLRRFAYPGLA